MDDKTKRGAADRRLIDFNDRDEVMRACRAMRCNELELDLAAAAAESNDREQIRAHLAAARERIRNYRKAWRAAERKRAKKAGRSS